MKEPIIILIPTGLVQILAFFSLFLVCIGAYFTIKREIKQIRVLNEFDKTLKGGENKNGERVD